MALFVSTVVPGFPVANRLSHPQRVVVTADAERTMVSRKERGGGIAIGGKKAEAGDEA